MFIGYLDTLWASFGAQLVKNPPAMQATWIRSLGLGRFPWRRERLPTHCSILARRIPWTVWSVGSQRVGLD